jgi:hypothetical protein
MPLSLLEEWSKERGAGSGKGRGQRSAVGCPIFGESEVKKGRGLLIMRPGIAPIFRAIVASSSCCSAVM